MRDHPPEGEEFKWVHVASAASRVVLDTASRACGPSNGSPDMSGHVPTTSQTSRQSGAKPAARIELPWPPTALTPHAKGGWRSKAKATREYRRSAFWLAKAAGVVRDPAAVLRVTYHPPDRQRRDCQNVHGRIKAAIDGIADAMGCDDVAFRVQFPDSFSDVRQGGAVVVEINPECGGSNRER